MPPNFRPSTQTPKNNTFLPKGRKKLAVLPSCHLSPTFRPKWCQKTSQMTPKPLPDAPGRPDMGPKWSQRPPKVAPDTTQSRPTGPRDPPNDLLASTCTPMDPWGTKRCPTDAKMHPKWPPNGVKIGKKTSKSAKIVPCTTVPQCHLVPMWDIGTVYHSATVPQCHKGPQCHSAHDGL